MGEQVCGCMLISRIGHGDDMKSCPCDRGCDHGRDEIIHSL